MMMISRLYEERVKFLVFVLCVAPVDSSEKKLEMKYSSMSKLQLYQL